MAGDHSQNGGSGLAAKVETERLRIASERARLEEEISKLTKNLERHAVLIPDIRKDFDDRIAELQHERDKQLTALEGDLVSGRRDLEALIARRDNLPSVSQKSLVLLEEDLRAARTRFQGWLVERADKREALARVRAETVQRLGESAVGDYDEMRRRILSAQDPVERRAYEIAERAIRIQLSDYAVRLDKLTETFATPLSIVVLSTLERPKLILVAPIPADARDGDDLCWRIRAFLVEAAERAKDANAIVTLGDVHGNLSVVIEPWALEAHFVEVALSEAWETRRTLIGAGLSLHQEIVPGIEPPFVPIEEDEQPGSDDSELGGSLLIVARRLGMALPDLVASLLGNRLPFPDDLLEAGVEQSVRTLLGIGVSARREIPSPSPPVAPSPAVPQPLAIASRLLGKLVRDHRIGSRHTSEDHAWGHHFADDEKDLAREVTRRLVREGILLEKNRNGAPHVSINPRRVKDAHRIVGLSYPVSPIFDGL
ncbi:MAG: hypothetical protein QM723_27420 [Myxococcaceae bacterium]